MLTFHLQCSARLALPGPEERSSEAAANPADTHGENLAVYSLMPLPPADGSSYSRGVIVSNCEPIIEEPASPKEENADGLEREIEDAFYEDSDEIPTIKINLHEFTQNIEECIKESNNDLQTEDITKALVAITTEAASIPAPKLKNVSRLRTEHQVYVIFLSIQTPPLIWRGVQGKQHKCCRSFCPQWK